MISLLSFAKFPNRNTPSSQTGIRQVPKQEYAKFPNKNAPNSQIMQKIFANISFFFVPLRHHFFIDTKQETRESLLLNIEVDIP